MPDQPRPKVLVVEDEWLIAQFVEDVLLDMGCEVLGPVPSVAQAITIIAEAAPDAAVLDISLGRENSLPIADALLERNVPFLFASGYLSNDLPGPYAACTVLAKPISASDLQTNLRRLLASGVGNSGRHS